MVKHIFVSGLPRSGSTLLVNILAQHPQVQIVPASGLLEVLYSLRNQWGKWIEHQQVPYEVVVQRMRSTFDAIVDQYDPLKPGKLVRVHKSRGWIAYPELLPGNSKLLVPTRNIHEILHSWDNLRRKKLEAGGSDDLPPQIACSRELRFQHWLRPGNEPIGLAVARLRELEAPHINVPFETLTSNPRLTMEEIWQRCGMEAPFHDFDNVIQVTEDDNELHGIPHLHTIRSQVRPVAKRA